MDVDVKNAIDRLLMACRQIDDSRHGDQMVRSVVRDIHSFIKNISTANADGRNQLFDQLFLSEFDCDADNSADEASGSMSSFEEMCRIDETLLKGKNISLGELYTSALAQIGKYYVFNKRDNKDIDAKKFAEMIREMQDKNKKVEKKAAGPVSETTEKKTLPQNTGAEQAPETDVQPEEPEVTLEDLMNQLNSLIGLGGVKNEVNSLINLLKVNKVRAERGLKTADVSKHLVFLGNPGTGKTTVARLLSKIYKKLGALETGQLVEVDRAGLVAGYVGQTALKTKEKIDEAMGGILFIDEAYTLVKGGNDFGQEAIDTILKAMEDNRDSFVVIVAGYPEPMNAFLESNPGLKSRFNKNIVFEDYNEGELSAIFSTYCEKYGLRLNSEAEKQLAGYLHELCLNKPENFANGREMRNLFETAYSNQANRLAKLTELSDDTLNEITVEDLGLTNLF